MAHNCNMSVFLCPLCSQPRFNNLESLRFSLIKAATQNISCPICDEILVGLDKFTIHLFGHSITPSTMNDSINLKTFKIKEGFPPFSFEKTKVSPPRDLFSNAENLFDICEFEKGKETPCSKNNGLNCTINMEDLGFLTSFESCLNSDTLVSDEKVAMETNTVNAVPENGQEVRKGSTELSEYMSDLLNKKLPVIDFAGDSIHKTKSDRAMELQNGTKQYQESEFSDHDSKLKDFISPFKQQVLNCCASEEGEGTKGNENRLPEGILTDSNFSNKILFKDLMLPQYDCYLCKKSFKMKGSLLIHYKMAHLGLNNSQTFFPSEIQEGTDISDFKCSICNKSFKRDQYLIQHIRTHEGKHWRCDTCNKCFTTKYFLKKHQRLHTGETPYSCQKCNKTFTFQQSYHKHLLYHSDEKPYKCMQCGKTFKELSTLHNHQRIHSGEKPFACETCGKCFRQRVSYIVHQRIHTGVLPYECAVCHRKFRYKVSQRSHKCALQPKSTIIEV